jgi:hypothetical protein
MLCRRLRLSCLSPSVSATCRYVTSSSPDLPSTKP